MNTQSYSLQKTISYINYLLLCGRYKPGDRLPSTRAMAQHLKVSRDTIRQSVSFFISQKKLNVEKKIGIRVPFETKTPDSLGPDGFAATPIEMDYLVWQRVEKNLKEDILDGNFKHGTLQKLPSIKELKLRYQTSYSPIKKAITSLKQKGLISIDHTTDISLSTRKTVTPTIVLITSIHYQIKESMNDREYFLIRTLEIECKNAHCNLEICMWSNDLGAKIASLMSSHSLRGVIIYCNKNDETLHSVSACSLFRVPVAVVNASGDLKVPAATRNIQVFTYGTTTGAGSEMARLLISLGHTTLAFISCHHAGDYSIKRLKSLSATFEYAQKKNHVIPFTIQGFDGNMNTINTIISPLLHTKAHTQLLDASQKLAVMAQTETHLSSPIAAIDFLKNNIAATDWFYYSLIPLFEAALANPKITAWVCADDKMALLALCFLQRKGIRVPEDISVAGFEDVFEALPKGLTTYNFNMPALISRCLRFIQFSKEKFGPRGNRPIEIIGHVIERKTTGPARIGAK